MCAVLVTSSRTLGLLTLLSLAACGAGRQYARVYKKTGSAAGRSLIGQDPAVVSNVTVAAPQNASANASASNSDSAYYYDDAPGNLTLNDTNVSNATNVTAGSCVTRYEPRADAMTSHLMTSIAPTGTPCLFGVDPRDEGKHCIHEDDDLGSFGWCFTTADQSQWGSCGEKCPLIGHPKLLGERIDDIKEMLHEMNDFVHEKLGEKENGTSPAALAAVEKKRHGGRASTDSDRVATVTRRLPKPGKVAASRGK